MSEATGHEATGPLGPAHSAWAWVLALVLINGLAWYLEWPFWVL